MSLSFVAAAILNSGCDGGPATSPPFCGDLPACAFGQSCINNRCVAVGDGGATTDAGTTLDGGLAVDGGASTDGGLADAGITDAGVTDAGLVDAGLDAGTADAGLVDAGLDAGLADAGPSTLTATRLLTGRGRVRLDWTMPGTGQPLSSYGLVRRSCDGGAACPIATESDFASSTLLTEVPMVMPAGTALTFNTDAPLQRASTFAVRSTDVDGGTSTIVSSETVEPGFLAENIPGPSGETEFGASIKAASIDGDALSDLIVGRPGLNSNAGAVRILYGSGRTPTDIGAAEVGLAGTSRFGRTVDNAGDVDGDGFDDVVVGAPGVADATCTASGAAPTGRVLLFFGGPSGLRRTATPLECRQVGATADCFIALVPPPASGVCSFGHAVAGLGNVAATTGGRSFFAVGAGDLTATSTRGGKVFVYSVSGTRPAVTVTLVATLVGGADDFHFGAALCGVRDVNGDGFPDFVVGAHRRGQSPPVGGRAYVFLGGSAFAGSEQTLTVTSGGAGTADGIVPITRNLGGDSFGNSCSRAGDLDGDGINDFVIAAAAGPQLGFYAVRGRANLDAAPPIDPPDLYLVTVAGSTQPGEVAGGVDFDGDGRPDVVMGDTTRVLIFPGQQNGLVGTTPIASFVYAGSVSTGYPVAVVPNWRDARVGESPLPDLAIGRAPGAGVLIQY